MTLESLPALPPIHFHRLAASDKLPGETGFERAPLSGAEEL